MPKICNKKLLKDLQSVLEKLIYVDKCVRPARVLINRMLDLLYTGRKLPLTMIFHDPNKFLTFLPHFNGVICTHKMVIQEDHTLHVDASHTQLGGIWSNRFIHPVSYDSPNLT